MSPSNSTYSRRNARRTSHPQPQPQPQPQPHPDPPPNTNPAPNPNNIPPPPPLRAPFSWSHSLLTLFILLTTFAFLCAAAAWLSTAFALVAAVPMYARYPSLVAGALIGAACALVCYIPAALGVVTCAVLFGVDIRVRAPSSGESQGSQRREGVSPARVARSVFRDAAQLVRIAGIGVPLYVALLGTGAGTGGGAYVRVETRALEAASAGQFVALVAALRIMRAGVGEVWDLLPLVVMSWHRMAARRRREEEEEQEAEEAEGSGLGADSAEARRDE